MSKSKSMNETNNQEPCAGCEKRDETIKRQEASEVTLRKSVWNWLSAYQKVEAENAHVLLERGKLEEIAASYGQMYADLRAVCVDAGIDDVNKIGVVEAVKKLGERSEHWHKLARLTLQANDELESKLAKHVENANALRKQVEAKDEKVYIGFDWGKHPSYCACILDENGKARVFDCGPMVMPASEPTLSDKIRNRAQELVQRDGCSFTTAFKMAEVELDRETTKVPQHTHSQKLAPAGKVAMVMLCVAVALIVVIFIKVITA